MCGIAGIFAYRENAPPVEQAELLRIREDMTTRGPDGDGLWVSGDSRIGLAHRRLAVLDLSSTGAQPMWNARRSLCVTFNGQIYNHGALRAELERKGCAFRSRSDTEVLLHLYEERGAEMVHALRGMFSFGIWDVARKALFLARDPFGIKPLYYSDDGDTLRFASQVKALRAGRTFRDAIEPAGYAGFFLWGCVPEPYTLYRGIRSLPAGHCLTAVHGCGGKPRQYHSLRDEFIAAEQGAGSPRTREDAVIEVREALKESVSAHLAADVPVGTFLSAGLDSAMLAGASGHGRALQTVTLGFEEFRGSQRDETAIAAATAAALGTTHATHWISYERFREEFTHILESMDQPSTDGVNTYFVAACARNAGLKVALSGVGGDEAFGTYPSFRQVPRMARLLAMARAVPALARGLRRFADPLLRPFTSPKYAGLAEYGGTLGGAYLLRRALFMPWELPGLIDPGIAAAGLAELATLERLDESIRGIVNPRSAVACLEMSWYMRNQLLRDSDWAGMAHSLEIRVPFVDVHFVARAASALAASAMPSKPAVAASLGAGIPRQALERTKTGFAVPVRDWVARMEGRGRARRGSRGWASRVFADVRRDWRPLLVASDLYGRTGGIGQFNRDLVRALCAHERVTAVDAIVRNTPLHPEPAPEGVHVHPRAPGRYAFARAMVGAAIARRRQPAGLIICGHINLLPFALLARAVSGGKVLLVLHGIEAWAPARKWLAGLCIESVDAMSVVSRHTLRRFRAWAPETGAPTYLLPDCVDLERFTPGPRDDAIVERHGLRGFRVLFTIGRFERSERYKGVDEILESLTDVLQSAPDLKYLVAGPGSDLPRLRAKAAALGLADRVIFAGYVAETDKVAYYRSVDAFAMPGRGEGFGIVYLEALACGLPAIGSVLDASREALLDGRMGEIVDPHDRPALAEAILRALAAPRRVPAEIEHYSYANFERRSAGIVDDLLAGNAMLQG